MSRPLRCEPRAGFSPIGSPDDILVGILNMNHHTTFLREMPCSADKEINHTLAADVTKLKSQHAEGLVSQRKTPNRHPRQSDTLSQRNAVGISTRNAPLTLIR